MDNTQQQISQVQLLCENYELVSNGEIFKIVNTDYTESIKYLNKINLNIEECEVALFANEIYNCAKSKANSERCMPKYLWVKGLSTINYKQAYKKYHGDYNYKLRRAIVHTK